MKKYLLPIMFMSLLYWSCEEAEVLPEDCLGVEGGTALVDSCGVCDSDSTNDCTEDCAGVFGGTALVDSCGVCDADTTNDCIQDCSGEWGGDNICGCTDASASNYNSDATFDDGTCFICEVEMEVLVNLPFFDNIDDWMTAFVNDEEYEFPSDWDTNCEAYYIKLQELFDNNCPEVDDLTQEDIDDRSLCTLNDG